MKTDLAPIKSFVGLTKTISIGTPSVLAIACATFALIPWPRQRQRFHRDDKRLNTFEEFQHITKKNKQHWNQRCATFNPTIIGIESVYLISSIFEVYNFKGYKKE